MRVYDNGVYRDASAAEISALETEQGGQVASQVPTEERLGALETQIITINNGALKTRNITLLETGWVGVNSPYSQAVTINGITANTKVDLQPSPEVLSSLQNDEITLVSTNDNCAVTIYSVGAKPSADMIIQVTLSEVTDG